MYAILSTAPQMQCRKISYGHTQTAGIFFLTFRGGVQWQEGGGGSNGENEVEATTEADASAPRL